MTKRDPMRTLHLIGASAALLAALGLAILVFWFVIRFPRF
jgi:high-affinity Fe2+/Pb2+ permease